MGYDAAERMGEYARHRFGPRAFVLSDANTRRAAGDAPLRALRDAGKRIQEHTLGSEPIDGTDALAEEIRSAADDAGFILAIGAGTICDLAKYAGHLLERPVVCYPTAASMNGYTSGIAALKVNGLKRTIPCTPAEAIFAHPEVSAAAPAPMVAAGIADFLSKCSSSTDWRVSASLRGAYYCDRPREFFEGAQDKVLAAAPKVTTGDPDAFKAVLEALMLSGFSMVLAGSSAPASGGEHLISHYLDMKSALNGTPHDLHGAQVGVGTIHCLGLWEKILALDPQDIDIEACIAAQPDSEFVRAKIEDDWGSIASEVWNQWKQKELTGGVLRAELEKFRDRLPALREACSADLLPSKVVARAIRAAGGPTDPTGLNVPLKDYKNALANARYIRNRFTVLDLARELCVK